MPPILFKKVGLDDFERDIFISKKGTYIVRIGNEFYTKVNNDINGEPCCKVEDHLIKIVDNF